MASERLGLSGPKTLEKIARVVDHLREGNDELRRRLALESRLAMAPTTRAGHEEIVALRREADEAADRVADVQRALAAAAAATADAERRLRLARHQAGGPERTLEEAKRSKRAVQILEDRVDAARSRGSRARAAAAGARRGARAAALRERALADAERRARRAVETRKEIILDAVAAIAEAHEATEMLQARAATVRQVAARDAATAEAEERQLLRVIELERRNRAEQHERERQRREAETAALFKRVAPLGDALRWIATVAGQPPPGTGPNNPAGNPVSPDRGGAAVRGGGLGGDAKRAGQGASGRGGNGGGAGAGGQGGGGNGNGSSRNAGNGSSRNAGNGSSRNATGAGNKTTRGGGPAGDLSATPAAGGPLPTSTPGLRSIGAAAALVTAVDAAQALSHAQRLARCEEAASIVALGTGASSMDELAGRAQALADRVHSSFATCAAIQAEADKLEAFVRRVKVAAGRDVPGTAQGSAQSPLPGDPGGGFAGPASVASGASSRGFGGSTVAASLPSGRAPLSATKLPSTRVSDRAGNARTARSGGALGASGRAPAGAASQRGFADPSSASRIPKPPSPAQLERQAVEQARARCEVARDRVRRAEATLRALLEAALLAGDAERAASDEAGGKDKTGAGDGDAGAAAKAGASLPAPGSSGLPAPAAPAATTADPASPELAGYLVEDSDALSYDSLLDASEGEPERKGAGAEGAEAGAGSGGGERGAGSRKGAASVAAAALSDEERIAADVLNASFSHHRAGEDASIEPPADGAPRPSQVAKAPGTPPPRIVDPRRLVALAGGVELRALRLLGELSRSGEHARGFSPPVAPRGGAWQQGPAALEWPTFEAPTSLVIRPPGGGRRLEGRLRRKNK